MWYLQTNNKLKEETHKKKEKELTFEEKFNNEIIDVIFSHIFLLLINIVKYNIFFFFFFFFIFKYIY